jgi:hypothetical protein
MLQLLHTCDIARNAKDSGSHTRTLQTRYQAVQSLFLPQSAQTTISNGFELGRAYDVYFSAGQDVKVGDVLSRNGQTYSVKAVQPYEVPIVGHVHVMAEQEASS